MTNPYEVLGVTPSASIGEIEARYRLLIREYHPDLHQDEGPEALAFCESMTRNLNAAMTRIRESGGTAAPGGGAGDWGTRGWEARGTGDADQRTRASSQWAGNNPFYRDPSDEPHEPGYDRVARDWFGNPIDHADDEPVPCPFCGQGFGRLADYEIHLQHAHNFRQVPVAVRRSEPGVLASTIGWLRFIPAWFVGIVAFSLWKLFGFYYFAGGVVFLALVMWTQTSPRFKPRR